MNKRNVYNLLGAFALIVGFSSCEEDDTSYAAVDKPIVTTSATTFTVDEGTDLVIDLTSTKTYKSSMDFKLEVLGTSSAMDHDDFAVNLTPTEFESDGWGPEGYKIKFPANSLTHTFSLSAILDDVNEGTETIYLKLTTAGNHNGVISSTSEMLTVNIQNKPQTFLKLTFDWNQNFDLGGTMTSLCDYEYDNDFYVFNDAFSSIVAQAATADCPEVLEVDLGDFADGNYHIFQNVWDDGGLSGEGLPTFNVPVNVHYSRGGTTFAGTYVQDAANAVNSDFGSDPTGANLMYVVSVTVSGDTFTLFDLTTSTTIGSGRMAQLKSILKNKTNGLRKR